VATGSVASPRSDLDRKAGQVLDSIYSSVRSVKLVDHICNSYTRICQGASISARTLTVQDRDRLLFELVCFAAFNAYAIAPKFIGRKRLFKFEPDVESCHDFVDCLAAQLRLLAERDGWSGLEDSYVFAPTGQRLDPVARLNRYSVHARTSMGEAAENFIKRIAMALDREHYGVLEMLVGSLDLPIMALELGEGVMRRQFQ
jgi:hypothetical protein